MRLWVGRSSSSDFRTAEWRHENLRVADGRVFGEVTRPEQGRLAFFRRAGIRSRELELHLVNADAYDAVGGRRVHGTKLAARGESGCDHFFID